MENKKKELRKYFSNKRKTIDNLLLSQKIKKNTINLINKLIKSKKEIKIHVFLPIIKNKEINTHLIINELKNKNINFYISKSNFMTNELTNFEFSEKTILKENKYGIPEPINAKEYPYNDFDIVIIPLLCADNNGCRVGYGKGFYDRFLDGLKSTPTKIGINYFEPIKKITDTNKFDIRLNYLVTPENTYEF